MKLLALLAVVATLFHGEAEGQAWLVPGTDYYAYTAPNYSGFVYSGKRSVGEPVTRSKRAPNNLSRCIHNCHVRTGNTSLDPLLEAQLEETGRDVNKRYGEYNETALHIAAEKDLLEAAKWLINEGADLEAKNTWWDSPLHYAASEDSVDVARLLISRGAKVDAKNTWWDSPLHYAASEDSVDVVRLLISRGAKVDAKTNDGWTPLHYAAYWNFLQVARLLIDNGTDKNIENDHGRKPIYYARLGGHSEMVALLQ